MSARDVGPLMVGQGERREGRVAWGEGRGVRGEGRVVKGEGRESEEGRERGEGRGTMRKG